MAGDHDFDLIDDGSNRARFEQRRGSFSPIRSDESCARTDGIEQSDISNASFIVIFLLCRGTIEMREKRVELEDIAIFSTLVNACTMYVLLFVLIISRIDIFVNIRV